MSTKHLPGEHDQLTHAGGRGGSDGASDLSATDYRKVLYGEHAGTPDDPVPCGGDIERAAQVIADGGHVTLDQPDEVATLLDKLRDIVKDAEAKGEEAPIYDLCNVSVPGTNLFCQDSVTRPDGSKIDRVEMPQLSTKKPVPGSPADAMPRNKKGEVDLSGQFGEFLASSGRTVTDTTISASHLRASQDDLNGGKVAGIAGAMAAGIIDVNDPKNAIYVTRDNYVIDGHHRWAAAVAEQYTTGKEIDMPVRVVDMDIGTALTVANFWTEEMGIPPASASETKKSYDPWLFRVAIGTPELLDVVRKMAEDPAPAPKHLPGEHDQLDHAGGGQQGRLDLRGEIPLAEAVREQFETQSGGPLANTQGFEGGEVLGYDAGFQYADFGGDVYRRPPGGAFRWESSREHFDHFSARGAFPGFIPGKHLPGQHDQDTHGRGGGNPLPGAADPPRTGPTGEIQASDAGDAWSQLDADRFDRDQQEKAHPENYEPNRGFGVHLKLGATEWRRDVSPEGVPTIYQVLGTDPRTLPIEDRASAGLPMSAPDGTPIVALRVEGSEQPDPFVYRVMSVSEFDQAQERGYFESNQSMNLADEGTVTSRGSTGTFYAPPNGEDMRIVQLDMDPDDGWKVDRDGYVKTHQRVPFARARAYSTPLANPRAMKAFDPNQPRDPLGRWVVHGFQAGLPRSEENPFREYTVEAPSASDAAVEAQRLAQEEFGDRTSYGFVPSYVEEVPAVPGITADDPAELLSNLDNGYESPEEIAAALQQLGAVEVKFDAPGVESVYLYQPEDGSEPTVITWDGKTDYSETHNAYDWVGEQDPEDYFPEHDQEFSDQFWRNPDVLYHGTDPANIDSILENGLERRNETRGISNRYEGAAVYTSIDPDDAEYYYGQVLVIDTAAMAADGFKPFVNQEPEVVRSDLQGALANQIGLYDYDPEYEPDMNPNTVVVNADIPPQYITVMSLAKARAVYTAKHLPGEHDQLTHGRGGVADVSTTTPQNYRATWRPTMTPEEGHAWAEAAGTKYPKTVVHMTRRPAVDGIRGTGFDMSEQAVHEAGRYFALDPESAEFYSYKGNQAVSAVVVAQNPVVLDWRDPGDITEAAQVGNFRLAAIAAAGYDLDDPTELLDSLPAEEPMVEELRSDLAAIERGFANGTLDAGDRLHRFRDLSTVVADDALLTTEALKARGFDSVIIYPLWDPDTDPTTGGQQIVVFDREQAVVIGNEDLGSRFVPVPGVGAPQAADYTARIERAFAKHLPGQHDQLTHGGGESGWEGFPFDVRKGEGPRPGDTPPERTATGDYVMYHGTTQAAADAIEGEQRVRPDDIGTVGLATTPGAARIYGLLHGGAEDAVVLRVTVAKDWLEEQRASHEIGGSGHDAFLVQPAHGRRSEWEGVPPEAIVEIQRISAAKHLPGQHDQLTHGRDAAERLSRLLPNATVSFSGLSPEDADELSAGIGEVAEDFPAAAALIRRVYPVDAGGTGVFSARYIPGEIQIASDQRGPHGPRWSGAHEMGHAVLESIGLVPPYRHAVGDAKGQRELLKAAGAEGETDDELRKWLGSTVTRYAGSGIWAEAIAESLAASYESDSPAARKFGLQVRKELKKRGARKPKHLPGQHDQLTHGRGGGGIPDTDDDRARINSAAAMQEAAAARGLYPGGEVHYIGRYDGRFYQGTITKIDEQGVHLDVPASSTYGSSRNEDSIKQPDEISPIGEMPVIPEGAPVYELANGRMIVGPWEPQFPDLPAEFATLIRPDGVATVLTAREARSAIREDAAVIRPVEVGDLVVATTGDVGTLVRLNGRGEGTAAIKLSNGQILADVSKGLQHAGTWETPAGWTAAGVTPDREKAREVYSVDDGSGRVYAITYPAGWKDNTNTIQGMREALVMAIEDNHAMEADTGTKSGWRGTLNFEENQRHNVAGTKEWDCSITIGSSVTRGMRSGAPESGRFWNPADEQDARGVLVHELAHAMSNLRAGPYQADPGWEEGVVEAYRQSFMAVQAYGADELSRRDAPGYRSYSPWVDALDSGMRLAGRGRTHGDRLAYYRELLPLVPIDRSRSVDQQIKDAGHSVHVALTGEPGGWGRGGEPSGHLVTAEKSAEMSEADVREVIYSARTLAQVKKALDVFYAYAESHPDTSMSLRMDAEWLVMFITAHEETTGKKHLPGQHDQLDHGRGGQSGESGVPRVTADQAEEIVRTYEPRSTEDEYGEPITTGLFLRWTADPEGDLSRGYSINHQTGESEMGLSVTETTAAQTWHGLDTGTTLAERITEYGFGGGEPYLVEAWWNGYARGSDGEPVVEPIRFVAKIREDGRKHLPGQHDQLDHGVRGPSTDAGAIVSGGTPEPEWRMDHQPDSEGAPSYDLTQIMPADVYEHPEWYAITNSGDPDYDRASRESIAALMRIRGHPNARVRVYRSSPQGTRIGPGDWVSLSPTYARLEGKHPSDPSQDMPVHSMLVRARDVLFAGDDLNEFGYFPNQTPEQVARHDEAERSRVEERRRRRELEGKHLPGQHDQLDHGRRGPSAPGPELSVMEHSPTSLQVFARDDSGAEVGRLTMMQNHGEWSVLHVETSDELRRTGLATRMLEKFHAVRPDVDVVIRNFETAEGHQWAVAMTERHPDWVRMDDLQTQADELEGTIADLRNNAIPATSDPAEAAQLRRDAENLAAELAVVRQRLAGGNVELPETSVELPRTAEEVEAAWVAGTETFYRAIERIAGRPADDQTPAERVYRQRNIDAAEPEAVTEEQRARCAADAAEWYADPQIQKEFSAYGRPPVVAASRLVGIGDAGEDPAEQQVAGQWVNGTIFLYGNVAGNPDAPATEGFTVGGNDNRTTLTHEYGHQVMSVVGFDQEGEVSDFLMEFVQTIEGNAETPAQERENLKKNAGQISGYAVQGGPAETFAEAFALLHQPDFDIEDYTGGAREALQLLRDRIDADVRASRGILEGQEALFE